MRQSSILGGNSGFGILPLRHSEYFFTDTQMAAGLYQKYQNAVRGYVGNGDVLATADSNANAVVYVDATDTEVWETSIATGELDGADYAGYWLNDAADKFYIVTSDGGNIYFAYVTIDGTVTKLGSVAVSGGPAGLGWDVSGETLNSSAAHPIYGTTHCVVTGMSAAIQTSDVIVIDYENLTVVEDWVSLDNNLIAPSSLPPDKNGWMAMGVYTGNTNTTNSLINVAPLSTDAYSTTIDAALNGAVGLFSYQTPKRLYMAGEIWQVRQQIAGLSETVGPIRYRAQTMDDLTTINAEYMAMKNIPV